jgi:hypothetical protein
MSVESALADRYSLWWRLLCEDFGYREEAPGAATQVPE